jgi:predicted nucleic acid-binding protein
MKYVIDSSAAFKWVVNEPDSPKANLLREDFRNGIHQLFAPDIFIAEIANALLVAERRGIVPVGGYPRLLLDVLTTPPGLRPSISLIPRVTALTTANQISVYDGLYVALAEAEGCQLVTGDMKLVRGLQRQFPFVISVASLP